MRSLGVEFSASEMRYTILDSKNDNIRVIDSGRLKLTDTRDPGALRTFSTAVDAVLTSAAPNIVGIKLKPESGNMRSGAAALKMEGIFLSRLPCGVKFISGAKISKTFVPDSVKRYLSAAYAAASCAM